MRKWVLNHQPHPHFSLSRSSAKIPTYNGWIPRCVTHLDLSNLYNDEAYLDSPLFKTLASYLFKEVKCSRSIDVLSIAKILWLYEYLSCTLKSTWTSTSTSLFFTMTFLSTPDLELLNEVCWVLEKEQEKWAVNQVSLKNPLSFL